MSYRLRTSESLDDCFRDLDAWWGQGRDPGAWFASEPLLVVQSRHLRDWLCYQWAGRKGVVFPPSTLLSDEGIRSLLRAFLDLCGEVDDKLASVRDAGILFSDSLALLIHGELGRAVPGPEVEHWLAGSGRSASDRYRLAQDLAEALVAWSSNHGDLPLYPAEGEGDLPWQAVLWHRLFPRGARVLPLGAALSRTLEVMDDPVAGTRVREHLRGRMLRDPSGREQRQVAIFGSAFLPAESMRFVMMLGGTDLVDIEHFLFVPFRELRPDATGAAGGSAPEAAGALARSWAGLGLDLIRRAGEAAGAAARYLDLPLEPVWGPGPIRVLACPNRRREVEVLKEEILGLLDRDPGLRANEVVVLCPRPEDYRPLVEAIFPARDSLGHPRKSGDSLPWHFLDTPDSPTDFESALEVVLSLPGSSLRRSDVSALLSRQCFRRAFMLSQEDCDRMVDWIQEAGAKEYLDPARREAAGLPGGLEGTWLGLLQGLAEGLVYHEDLGHGKRAPLGLGLSDTDAARKFHSVLQALAELSTGPRWQGERRVEEWATDLRILVLGKSPGAYQDEAGLEDRQADRGRILHALSDDRGAQRLSEAISALVQRVMDLDGEESVVVDFELFRTLLAEHMEGSGSHHGQALLQGVAIARFQPFRLVPFRHVLCLGMTEGAFPAAEESRSLFRFGPGGAPARDQRPQDLYSFLETLATYRESLTLLYQGRDPETRAIRLPAAPLASLVSAVPERVKLMEVSLHSFLGPDLAPDRGPAWQPWDLDALRDGAARSVVEGLSAPSGEGRGEARRESAGEGREETGDERSWFLDMRDMQDLITKPLALYGRKVHGLRLRETEDPLQENDVDCAPSRDMVYELERRLLRSAAEKGRPVGVAADMVVSLVRQGQVAEGFFLDQTRADWVDQEEKLGKLFEELGMQGTVRPLGPEGPWFRIPASEAVVLDDSIRVRGTSGPWFRIDTAEGPLVVLLVGVGEKPKTSQSLRLAGVFLTMVAWFRQGRAQGGGPAAGESAAAGGVAATAVGESAAGRAPGGGGDALRLAMVFHDRKTGSVTWNRVATLAEWALWLPFLSRLTRRVLSAPLPIHGALLDDKDIMAAARGEGGLDLEELKDWFMENSSPETGPWAGKIPGNCPWYRLFFDPVEPLAPWSPWSAPDMAALLGDLEGFKVFLGGKEEKESTDSREGGKST